MEELLRRIVDQNDALIGLANTQIAALQDVVDKLGEIQTQLVLNDSSMEISQLVSAVEEIADKIGD